MRRRAPATSTTSTRDPIATLTVIGVVVLSVLCGLGSPAQPTGSMFGDALWNTAAALAVITAASRAGRWPRMWLLAVAAVLGIAGSSTGAGAAVVALVLLGALAWGAPLSGPVTRAVGVLAGAVAMVAMSNAPPFGPAGAPTAIAAVAVIPVMVSAW
ncbi:MAG: hypothetical protein ACKOIA_02695, partial [Acidimicrobiia bacterium]